jgi:glycosyltransferase involved in cell wall biosynthesis
MKVLMFGWEFPPHISGGLGTACHGLTKGLASFGDIDLTFVVPKAYGDEPMQNIKLVGANEVELSREVSGMHKSLEKIRLYKHSEYITAYTSPQQYEKTLHCQQEKILKVSGKKAGEKLEFTGTYGPTLFDEISGYGIVAAEIAGKEDYDVIHAHDWLTYPAGIEAKKATGKPLIVHVHATEFDRCGENHNKEVFATEQKGMKMADKVITVSNFTRGIVINKYKIDPSKVVTVHNAVEPPGNNPRYSISKGFNDYLVTFLGRITSQKGPEYFVQAAYKVLQKMGNVRFVMAGTGDLLENMVKYAARLKIADRFHFTGFLKGDDVYRMYGMSDLYVMPSVSEPFGISPLEAMQSQVPVIISKQSGVSEVITHAIKVDFWDIDAMADAIYGILNYGSLAAHLKENCKNEVDGLRWTDAAAKVKEIYYQVLYSKAG